MAILIKLMLIKRVANKRLGAATSFRIFSSVFFPDVFSSSISVGVSEKKADSAADTNETITNNTNSESIEKRIPAEKGCTVIVRKDDIKKWTLLGSYKVLDIG